MSTKQKPNHSASGDTFKLTAPSSESNVEESL
jgi:hypothetical protein